MAKKVCFGGSNSMQRKRRVWIKTGKKSALGCAASS